MPLYFFDLCDGDNHTIDDFGIEFDRLEEARNYAVSLLPDIAREELPDGPRRNFICNVRNNAGNIVYEAVLKFREKRSFVDFTPDTPTLQYVRCTDNVTMPKPQ